MGGHPMKKLLLAGVALAAMTSMIGSANAAYVLAMKGTAAMEELEEAKKAIKTLGLKLEEVREFPVDGTAHTVIVLKKVAPTPAKYPRRFAKIKQAPL